MKRFIREAKSAAALNHPHIVHIYEIGEIEGVNLIAMEFIDGKTPREKIHRDKTLLPKLLKYLTQVAEGLSKAHSAGVVHRDLKPDNIMSIYCLVSSMMCESHPMEGALRSSRDPV